MFAAATGLPPATWVSICWSTASVGGTPASLSWMRRACSRGPAIAGAAMTSARTPAINDRNSVLFSPVRPAKLVFVHVMFFITILLTNLSSQTIHQFRFEELARKTRHGEM